MIKNTIEHYSIHNILKFQVIDNRLNLHKSLVDVTGRYKAFRQTTFEEPDIIFEIGNFIPDIQNCSVLDGEYYVKQNYLYQKNKNHKLGGYISFEASGLEDEVIRIKINANLTGMPFIAGEVIDFFIHYALIKRGYSLLHASGLIFNETGIVFSGRGGGGKTTIALGAIAKNKYKFLGDNFIICHKGKIYSFISDLNMFGYNLRNEVWTKFTQKEKALFKLKIWLYKLTLGYIKIFTPISPLRLFPGSIQSEGNLSKFFILTTGPHYQISTADRNDIISRMVSNIKLEFFSFVRHTEEYRCLFPNSAFSKTWDNYRCLLEINLPKEISYSSVIMPKKISPLEVENILQVALQKSFTHSEGN